MDYIEDLRMFKRAGESDIDDLKTLYRHIELNILRRENEVK
jgi:hypothetical protein